MVWQGEHRRWRTIAALGGAALMGAMGLLGWTWAPTHTAPTSAAASQAGAHRGPWLAGPAVQTAIAQYLGISVQTLRADRQQGESLAAIVQGLNDPSRTVAGLEQAIEQAWTGAIQQAVAAGKLTPSRAQALEQHLPQMAAHLVQATPGMRRPGWFGGPAVQTAIVQYLGISAQTLRADRQQGESLAAIVQGLNDPSRTVAGLEQAIEQAWTGAIQQAVAAGKLTPSRAQALEQRLPQMAAHLVQATPHHRHAPTASAP
ncbi:MAG: hypothetical protein K6U14_08425 [Firmicutes bacterium]|nr:hypothetical protein [Alicyclobacillaceae bacterium]MCL6497634.1 hypothetical protein [Bacillota bacterium]